MNKALRTIGLIVVVALIAGVTGYFITKRYFPTTIRDTEVRYVDREITRRDTVTIVRPEVRTVYRTVRDTVTIRVKVPVGFGVAGVIGASPILFRRGDIILTYFSDSTFVQDRFRIPRPNWGYGLAAYAAARVSRFEVSEVGFETWLRYRRFTVFSRLFVDDGVETGFSIGLRMRLIGTD